MSITGLINKTADSKLLASLFEFYGSGKLHPLIMLLVFWVFWPGMMHIVALILESRKVYLGKGQSVMFKYGDWCLGIGTIVLIGIHSKCPVGYGWVYKTGYIIAVFAFFFVIMKVFRYFDVRRYPERSKHSPTKIAHDVSGYWICASCVLGLGIPELVWCFSSMERFEAAPVEWCIFLACAIFFGMMTIYDATHLPGEKELRLMHPDDWKPIWK